MDPRLQAKNILVFDVGNVLVRFDPRTISEGFGLPPALEEAVFGTGLWAWIDTGLMGTGDLARLMCRTVPTDSREDYLLVSRLLDESWFRLRLPSGCRSSRQPERSCTI